MPQTGKFITLEGPEGGGKSTHARCLAQRLQEEHGFHVLLTREPGGTPTGELIRGILQHDHSGEPIAPTTELLLFEASRAQLIHHVIRPALEQGTWVICDRFADSTTAYQGYGRGFDLATVLTINDFAIHGCTPDLTLLLDLEVRLGFQRIAVRHAAAGQTPDRMERETQDFHERVRAGYLALARRWPGRFRVIDATREPPQVAADIWENVRNGLLKTN